MDDMFSCIVFVSFVILSTCLAFSYIDNKTKEEIELIKNTKDYSVYEHCIELDGNYYCYD